MLIAAKTTPPTVAEACVGACEVVVVLEPVSTVEGVVIEVVAAGVAGIDTAGAGVVTTMLIGPELIV